MCSLKLVNFNFYTIIEIEIDPFTLHILLGVTYLVGSILVYVGCVNVKSMLSASVITSNDSVSYNICSCYWYIS